MDSTAEIADTARIRHDMPFAAYQSDPAVSRSQLRDLAESPRNYFALHRAPNRPPPKPPTPQMLAGSLAHCMLLEPMMVLKRYRVRPPGLDLRTREGKAWAADVQSDVEIVSDEQMTIAKQQRDAALAVPEVASLFEKGDAECSVFWIDPATLLRCKARPDWMFTLDDGRVIVVDLKTSRAISPQGFAREVVAHGYDLQAAHYWDGIERAGREVAAFMFVAVSQEYPFIAQPYVVPPERLIGARQMHGALLRLLRQCEVSNAWPAYGETVLDLEVPYWYPTQQQEQITRIGRLTDWIIHQPQPSEAAHGNV